jgi:hypothetical protein
VTADERWESGSAFPLVLGGERARPFGGGRFFGSGRQALMALLAHGREEFGWTAVHLPTYYCPDVVDDVASVVDVKRYAASPEGDLAEPTPGGTEVVVAVSYFGQPPVVPRSRGRALIVDATHDPVAPWLSTVGADVVFASLRKTLPLPDGGVLWSPARRALPAPAPATERHLAGAGQILAAMNLKAAYLAQGIGDKQTYLDLFTAGEECFRRCAPGEMSGYSRAALRTFPIERWRARRIANIATLTAALSGLDTIPSTFGVVLRFPSAEVRDLVRAGLIARRIYPAVLWDVAEPAPHRELAERLLFLHTDFRSGPADLQRVARAVRELSFAEVPC